MAKTTPKKYKNHKNKKDNIFKRFLKYKKSTKFLLLLGFLLLLTSISGIVIITTNDNIRENIALALMRQTKGEIQIEEEIEYEIINEDSSDLYRGETSVQQEGKKGILEITYKVVYDSDNNEIYRTKISEIVKEEPVAQINKIGTKEKPVQLPTPSNHYRTQQKNNTKNNNETNDNAEVQPLRTIPQFSDEDLINICDSAIQAKHPYGLLLKRVGYYVGPPSVERLSDDTYKVYGNRIGGFNYYIATSCTINQNGVVTNIER